MRIKLPYVERFDTLDLPDDFEDQVKESFGRFTVDTNTRYTWKDKMLYISRLPMYFKNMIGTRDDDIAENEIKNTLHHQLDYKLDEEDDVLNRDDIYSFEFMCQCFVDGMRYMELLQEYEPYSSGENDETEKVMFRIMQIVMNWEPEAEEHEKDNEC